MEINGLVSLSKLAKEKGGPIDASLPHLYKMARQGEIPVVRLGRRVLVPMWWVKKITVQSG